LKNFCIIFGIIAHISLSIGLTGCAPQIKLFTDSTDPLQEFTLQGKDKGKILLIPVRGIISDTPENHFLRSEPSMVQDIVSQLQRAEKDDEIKAVLLKVSSPGGSVTASDMLYHEIIGFKKRTGVKVIAVMTDMAASGGYYISLPADVIMAHPTTVTGSVGVIFMRPGVNGLMEKLGIDMAVNKSGKNKDMFSPFRKITEEEEEMLRAMVAELAEKFIHLVEIHRKPDEKALAEISTARICLAEKAQELGLIDEIGYLSDALAKAKSLSGLPEDAKVVVFRRSEYPDDNIYNTSDMKAGEKKFSFLSLGLPESLMSLHTGFYYLWPAGAGF
jgi:protease-4